MSEILNKYFEKSDNNYSACFFDREHKKVIVIYNNVIFDDLKKQYFFGYRDIKDIILKNEQHSIKICPVKQIEKRIQSGRYVYAGKDSSALFMILDLVESEQITFDALSCIMRNWDKVLKHYSGIEKQEEGE